MKALLSVAEFADACGRDRTTITRWLDSGELPAVSFGGRRYIPSRVLAELITTPATEGGAA